MFRLCIEVIKDTIDSVNYWFTKNLIVLTNIVLLLCPYAYMYLAAVLTVQRGYVAIGSEYLIPLLITATCGMLKGVANKLGKGVTVPVPAKRFTQVESDGEVTIPVERSEELILYMADLEDWLERQGVWVKK